MIIECGENEMDPYLSSIPFFGKESMVRRGQPFRLKTYQHPPKPSNKCILNMIKIKCSPNQDKEEVAMDVYERPGNILEWESLQLENINIINRVVTQLELPVFEVNSISLHQVIFSPNTRKLQISKLKVKVKRVTKEENVALDPKEMGADREFKVHMAMANMLRH